MKAAVLRDVSGLRPGTFGGTLTGVRERGRVRRVRNVRAGRLRLWEAAIVQIAWQARRRV